MTDRCFSSACGLARAASRRRRALLVIVCAALQSAGAPRAYDPARMISAAHLIGPRAVASVTPLQQLISQGSRATTDSSLHGANQFFNSAVEFGEDIDVWGEVDYWTSPLEMLQRGLGDCEDYAIGKFFSLAAMGVPVARLRMVYVKAEIDGPGTRRRAHMVLAYYPSPGSEPQILDNLVGDIRPASRRPDLTPVYSFNTEGLWDGVAGPSTGDSSTRLSRWRTVVIKARNEGF